MCQDGSAYQYDPLGEQVGWMMCRGCRMGGRCHADCLSCQDLSSLGYTGGPYSPLLAFLHWHWVCESSYAVRHGMVVRAVADLLCQCRVVVGCPMPVLHLWVIIRFAQLWWDMALSPLSWQMRWQVLCSNVSGWLRGKDKRKWTTTNIVVHFWDTLHGSPTSWASPNLSLVPP